MPDDEFKEQLERRIAGYRSMRDRMQADIRDLQDALEQVSQRLESAERMYGLEFGEPLPSTVVVELLPIREPTAEGPLTGLSWRQAMIRVLSQEGRPMHVRELWERLQAGGFRTDAQDPLRSIVAIAVRNDDLVKVRPNTYALRRPADTEEAPLF